MEAVQSAVSMKSIKRGSAGGANTLGVPSRHSLGRKSGGSYMYNRPGGARKRSSAFSLFSLSATEPAFSVDPSPWASVGVTPTMSSGPSRSASVQSLYGLKANRQRRLQQVRKLFDKDGPGPSAVAKLMDNRRLALEKVGVGEK